MVVAPRSSSAAFCGMLTGVLAAIGVPLRIVLAVLWCDVSRRALWRGGAILSLCRRRRRQRDVPLKAVSWVMAGGVFAGVLGPQLVQWTMDIRPPYLFAFSYVVQAFVALVAMAVLWGVDAPKSADIRAPWRPAAVRDRAAAALHRRSTLRRDRVSL